MRDEPERSELVQTRITALDAEELDARRGRMSRSGALRVALRAWLDAPPLDDRIEELLTEPLMPLSGAEAAAAPHPHP